MAIQNLGTIPNVNAPLVSQIAQAGNTLSSIILQQRRAAERMQIAKQELKFKAADLKLRQQSAALAEERQQFNLKVGRASQAERQATLGDRIARSRLGVKGEEQRQDLLGRADVRAEEAGARAELAQDLAQTSAFAREEQAFIQIDQADQLLDFRRRELDANIADRKRRSGVERLQQIDRLIATSVGLIGNERARILHADEAEKSVPGVKELLLSIDSVSKATSVKDQLQKLFAEQLTPEGAIMAGGALTLGTDILKSPGQIQDAEGNLIPAPAPIEGLLRKGQGVTENLVSPSLQGLLNVPKGQPAFEAKGLKQAATRAAQNLGPESKVEDRTRAASKVLVNEFKVNTFGSLATQRKPGRRKRQPGDEVRFVAKEKDAYLRREDLRRTITAKRDESSGISFLASRGLPKSTIVDSPAVQVMENVFSSNPEAANDILLIGVADAQQRLFRVFNAAEPQELAGEDVIDLPLGAMDWLALQEAGLKSGMLPGPNADIRKQIEDMAFTEIRARILGRVNDTWKKMERKASKVKNQMLKGLPNQARQLMLKDLKNLEQKNKSDVFKRRLDALPGFNPAQQIQGGGF